MKELTLFEMKINWSIIIYLTISGNCLISQEKINLPTTKLNNKEIFADSTDLLPLKPGYRWLSFPRMERYGDDPFSSESVLENLSVWPAKAFTLFPALGTTPKKEWLLTPPPAHWFGDLDLVQSTAGYKLYIGQSAGIQPKITLSGARLHPGTWLTIPGGNVPKDLGYFIEESQYPWDAFTPDVYNDNLTMIQSQYWTMYKTTMGWLSTNQVKPIKYGDMVIVKSNNPATFQWNDPDNSEEDIEISMPQAFTWVEKAEYTPFYIETESTSDIAEIAVMVDGVCMGATIRNPGDTLTEVNGYFEGLPVGSVLEFETWNGLKSTPVKRDGYIVFNPVTSKKEKRNIYIGETQDYYLVSLKQGEVYEIPDDVSHVTCQPNPFTNETTITIRLNSGQRIWVEVYGISGAKVKTLLDGDLPGGIFEVKWYGDNENGGKVSRGIYVYKIRTGSGTEISEKIVLIN
jgi:hypothetical protein